MYNINSQPITKYKSRIYIAKKVKDNEPFFYEDEIDQREIFEEPQKYYFNVQNNIKTSVINEYGETVNATKVVIITEKSKYLGKFEEFDRVYIETNPNYEIENGDNADYRISAVIPQNATIRLYLTKLLK